MVQNMKMESESIRNGDRLTKFINIINIIFDLLKLLFFLFIMAVLSLLIVVIISKIEIRSNIKDEPWHNCVITNNISVEEQEEIYILNLGNFYQIYLNKEIVQKIMPTLLAAYVVGAVIIALNCFVDNVAIEFVILEFLSLLHLIFYKIPLALIRIFTMVINKFLK